MSEPILSTKDEIGDYDAIESLKPGEPVFPVQGGDPFGPSTVLHWADLARTAARGMTDEKEAAALFKKASSAEQVAWAMQDYQRAGEGEEAPPEARALYSGGTIPEERKWIAGLTAGCRHLSDAAYHFAEAAAHLPDDQAQALMEAVGRIQGIREIYAPKRASYSNEPEFPGI